MLWEIVESLEYLFNAAKLPQGEESFIGAAALAGSYGRLAQLASPELVPGEG